MAKRWKKAPPVDATNPPHYRQHPSGVECIQITEHFNFNLGNVIKYVWRAGLKGDANEDLEKALWYLNREIALRNPQKQDNPLAHKKGC